MGMGIGTRRTLGLTILIQSEFPATRIMLAAVCTRRELARIDLNWSGSSEPLERPVGGPGSLAYSTSIPETTSAASFSPGTLSVRIQESVRGSGSEHSMGPSK